MLSLDDPRRPPAAVHKAVRIPPDLLEAFEGRAKTQGRTFSVELRRAMRFYLATTHDEAALTGGSVEPAVGQPTRGRTS